MSEPGSGRTSPWWLAVLSFLVAWTGTSPALGSPRIRTCIAVEAKSEAREGLLRLVRSEVDRHASHYAVESSCHSHLTVELIEVPGEGSWLTGRIDAQVPHRERLGSAGLAQAVERLLVVVLHNDPVRLHGPRSEAWFIRTSRSLKRGTLHFGAEILQRTVVLDSSVQTLGGAALSARREAENFHIGVRVGGAAPPRKSGDTLELRLQVDAELELGFYARPEADTSWFGALVVGYELQRFEGPAQFAPPDETTGAQPEGAVLHQSPTLGLRGGLELYRVYESRAFAFAQLTAPVLPAVDIDEGVVDQWTPSAALGAGVMF